jgi:hypothetical protein
MHCHSISRKDGLTFKNFDTVTSKGRRTMKTMAYRRATPDNKQDCGISLLLPS